MSKCFEGLGSLVVMVHDDLVHGDDHMAGSGLGDCFFNVFSSVLSNLLYEIMFVLFKELLDFLPRVSSN